VSTTRTLAAVTGAGSGIGLETSLELARRGYDVLALVENDEGGRRVAAAAGGLSIETQVVDVTDPGDFEFPADLAVLVNNAGARREFLPIEHIAPEDWQAVFAVNVFGLAEMTRRAIPALRRQRGVLCAVTSSAVLDLGPFFGAYRASKAAASLLCEQLRIELAPFGVRVVEILPGPTATPMANDGISARMAEAARYPEYRDMAVRQRRLLEQQPAFASAAQVARVIADAIEQPGPMRHGTDELSRRRLERWRRSDADERFMTDAISLYVDEPPDRVIPGVPAIPPPNTH